MSVDLEMRGQLIDDTITAADMAAGASIRRPQTPKNSSDRWQVVCDSCQHKIRTSSISGHLGTVSTVIAWCVSEEEAKTAARAHIKAHQLSTRPFVARRRHLYARQRAIEEALA